jgi:hypothetical protein
LQPELPCVPFNVNNLLDEVRSKHFPDLDSRVCFWFAPTARLASVFQRDSEVYILAHPLLNHPDTPREVIAFVIKHELLHLSIPPREVDGERTQHPPEFWTAEASMAPDGKLAWAWIWMNLGTVLRRCPKTERTEVTKRWRRLRSLPRATLQQVTDCYEAPSTEIDDVRHTV